MVLAIAIVGAGCAASVETPGATVTVETSHPGAALPADFLGLSFEASIIDSPLLDPAHTDLANLLRNLGRGHLRFGGNSLDRVTAWTSEPTVALPTWAHARVTPDDLARLGRLSSSSGWSVDLGLSLGHPDPGAAASEASAAARLIGAGLEAVQIGNEPDLLAEDRTLEPGGYSYSAYIAQVGAYRRAIASAVPGLPLAGPDTAGTGWLAAYGRDERPGLAFLAQHFYPLTRCGGARPTIPDLLSAATADREAAVAGAAVAAGRADGLPVRFDETNSASCGGQDGVSDTLASALWMTRYLLQLGQSGVAGVDVQGGLAACRGYTPLCVPGATGPTAATDPGIDPVADRSLGAGPAGATRVAAQPDYYALLLVHLLEGGRFLTLRSSSPEDVSTFAVVMPGGSIRVVLDNTDPARGANVSIPGLRGPAFVLRLAGPSIQATSGIRFGGAGVGSDGTWISRPAETIGPASGVRIAIGPASAAVVTFP
jgi:hypothetical protein